jgi:hypothetical protein
MTDCCFKTICAQCL